MIKKPVALIVGAGDYLGASLAKRFSDGGMRIVVTRRRGNLKDLVELINKAGGEAYSFHSDARNEQAVSELVDEVETNIGPVEVCIYNVGGNVFFPFMKTTSRVYRKVWELCCFGGFLVAKEVTKHMLLREKGVILFTGASASIRGKSGYSAFSSGKQALRALAQSLARELGPKKIHIAHIIIDGLIDNDNSRSLFPNEYADRPKDGILKPQDIAEVFWQISRQPKSTWSFEIDLRPYSEKF